MRSLYERLGGIYAIAAVVDDFIDRIMDDPRLNANPKVNEAHHRVSRASFKWMTSIEKFHREITNKNYKCLRPGIETMFYEAKGVQVIDPFGNRIRFNEDLKRGKTP
jgi:hypothetical protein